MEQIFHMFQEAESFNQDISNWDVSNGRIFAYMFLGPNFNQNIGLWDVGNGTTFIFMFQVLSRLIKISVIGMSVMVQVSMPCFRVLSRLIKISVIGSRQWDTFYSNVSFGDVF